MVVTCKFYLNAFWSVAFVKCLFNFLCQIRSNVDLILFAGIPSLNPFHVAMTAHLKDLNFRLKKIGGLQSLDSGKKKKYSSRSSSVARETDSTSPDSLAPPVSDVGGYA